MLCLVSYTNVHTHVALCVGSPAASHAQLLLLLHHLHHRSTQTCLQCDAEAAVMFSKPLLSTCKALQLLMLYYRCCCIICMKYHLGDGNQAEPRVKFLP